MKILSLLEKNKNFWFLLITSFLFFLLRFPSLFEPYWYGDEGIYQTIGIALNKGRLLYSQIWDNKPPLLYVLYALFSSDQFTVRLVSLIFGLLSVIVFFFLAKKLFGETKKIAVFISTAVFAFFFSIPLIEGNIANSENFMALPILLSAFLLLKARENVDLKKLQKYFFIAGLLLSIAFLFKIVAVFDFTAFFLFIFILKTRKLKDSLKSFLFLLPMGLGFILPILLTSFLLLLQGSFSDFIKAAFFQNVGYVAYGNTFLFPQSIMLGKLIILFLAVIFLYKIRKNISQTLLFILVWTFFSVFNALFSQRPYTHYFLTLLPAFSLLIGLVFFEEKYKKEILLVFFGTIIIAVTNFHFYSKTTGYYQNFLQFLFASKDVSSYQAFFDRHTPTDYALADFIKQETGQADVFIWGNDAQVYKLSNKLPIGRYTVAYHMTSSKKSLDETRKAFYQKKPKFVILVSKDSFPFVLKNYSFKFNLNDAAVYEKIL